MFVDKKPILSWEWARVIVRIMCNRGVPRFQKLPDARTAFVNDRCVVKINDMVMSSMIKRVLGQPNFSPQTNATQLFPKLTQTLTTYHPLKLTQIYRLC